MKRGKTKEVWGKGNYARLSWFLSHRIVTVCIIWCLLCIHLYEGATEC